MTDDTNDPLSPASLALMNYRPTGGSERPSAMVQAYSGRWKWWYEAIADYIIANPDARQHEIAASLKRHPNTISAIMGTDYFRTYLALRRQQWRENIDFKLRNKLTRVAEVGLDVMYEHLEKKRTNVPMEVLAPAVGSILDKLGYGAKQQSSAVQVTIDQRQQIVAPVSLDVLEEARSILRRNEAALTELPRIEHQSVPTVENFDDPLDIPAQLSDE